MNGNVMIQNNSSGLPATKTDDPFTSYGEKMSQTTGQFLSFDKGVWLYGQDKAKLPNGTRLAANIAGLMVGWRHWWGGRVTEDLLEPLVDQKPVPTRSSLGDLDTGTWERDERSGQARDPWVFTNTLQLVDNEGESYLYSASSKGGLNAIGRLCKVYGQEYRQRPGMVPIVELGGDSYMHSNAEYGLIHTPELRVVGWTDAKSIETGGDEAPNLPLPSAVNATGNAGPLATGSQRAANPTPPAAPAPQTTTSRSETPSIIVTTETISPGRRVPRF